MTRDREGSSKSSKNTKKHTAASTETCFIKKQKDLVSGLKAELQSSIAEKQQIRFAAMEKNKCIQELQKRYNLIFIISSNSFILHYNQFSYRVLCSV